MTFQKYDQNGQKTKKKNINIILCKKEMERTDRYQFPIEMLVWIVWDPNERQIGSH